MTAQGRDSGESTSTMRDRAHHVAGEVVDKVQGAANTVLGSSSGEGDRPPITDRAKEQVSSRMDMGREYVANTMKDVAQALRKTGEQLREEGSQPMLGQYADRGADQIELLGGYLRKSDTSKLLDDAEQFAQRQPLVFAGGAFALGMLAVRFLRTGGRQQEMSSSQSTSGYRAASSGSSVPATRQLPERTGTAAMPQSPSSAAPGQSRTQPMSGSTAPRTGPGSNTPAGTPAAPNRQSPQMPPPLPSTSATPTNTPRTSDPRPGTSDDARRAASPAERPGPGTRPRS